MDGLIAVLGMGVTFVVIVSVQCSEDMMSVISRIDDLNADMIRVEERVVKQIDWAKISLRSELKHHISEHVREAIAEILQGESIEEMVRSQVITEVRHLKRVNHQMKRQLNHVLMSLTNVREEMNTYKDALEEAKSGASELKASYKYAVDTEILRRDFEQCKRSNDECSRHSAQKDKDIIVMEHNLEVLNQTCQSLVKPKHDTSSTEPCPTSATVTTSLTTTSKPREERGRIIIAPIWSSTQHQFRQLNIHSNTVTTYQLHSFKQFTSIAYVSKLRQLLIGLRNPDKIISSNLDRYDVIMMRENVETYGMAVDEEREIVFLTTNRPRYTISRMTTQGKDFTAITDLSDYGNYPRAIAVNSKEKKIYACNHGQVFMVTYDGRGLQTLATGSNMRALTLDNTGSVLYYTDDKQVMKMSLSDNVSEVITTLSVYPWTFAYYRDTIYYISYGNTTIGAVNVRYDIVSYKMQTMKDLSSYQAICLVP